MTENRNHLFASLALVPASLLVLALLAEVFFRLVLPAPEVPRPAYLDEVLRHEPGQTGVFWHGRDYRTPFAINAQGWNSGRAQYPLERGAALRIAVVGDSYVEALQVPPQASLAEGLERELAAGGAVVEVFRYGISGAPLSQYLHMVRRAVLPARPDVVAVLLVHNDFDESYRQAVGLYTKSFLTFELGAGGAVTEIPPVPYRQGALAWLRNRSATWRYLSHGTLLNLAASRALILGSRDQARYEANVDVTGLEAREALDRRATAYGFGQLQAACAAARARLVLLMDGVRAGIEAGQLSGAEAEYESGALRLNRMARQEAERLGIPFVDLHPVFAQDFRRNARPFAHPTDGHWNAYAHSLAARALAAKLRELGLVAPARLQ